MTTFTWTNTTPGGDSWTTSTDWNPQPISSSFTLGTSSFLIADADASGPIVGTIAVPAGQSVANLTVDSPGVILNFAQGNDDTFNGGITLTAGTINANFSTTSANTINGTGAFLIGSGGVLNIGAPTVAAPGFNLGSGLTLQGSGTVDAASGYSDIAGNVAASSSLRFEIGSTSTVEVDGSFGNSIGTGENVIFTGGGSGLLLLNGSSSIGNGGTFGATIANLPEGSSLPNGVGIDINSGENVTSDSLIGTNRNTLVVDYTGGSYNFVLAGSNAAGVTAGFAVDTTNGGTDLFLVCYGAGTAILTDSGEVAVESIEVGDTVMTLADGVQAPRAVKWVGRRDLDLTRHPNPDAIAPVRVMAGALGDNLPRRDLVLSPDHCLFIDGALFPAKLLVNGMTIVRDLAMKTVSYFHVELDRHAVMIAEGVAAESYLDTGNRAFFGNAGLATILHPELNINENLRCWNTDACAPLTVKPELVKPVWQRIADRAVALGFTAPVHATTRDAGIHLMVDGKVVRPLATQGKTVSFMVPGNARSVRLVSRAARQSALTPWLDDPRTLGVAIRSVTLRDTTGESVLSADHPALRDGWHAAEHMENGAFWRWSTGDAVLPLVTSGPCMMEIALSDTATYIESAQRLAA